MGEYDNLSKIENSKQKKMNLIESIDIRIKLF